MKDASDKIEVETVQDEIQNNADNIQEEVKLIKNDHQS